MSRYKKVSQRASRLRTGSAVEPPRRRLAGLGRVADEDRREQAGEQHARARDHETAARRRAQASASDARGAAMRGSFAVLSRIRHAECSAKGAAPRGGRSSPPRSSARGFRCCCSARSPSRSSARCRRRRPKRSGASRRTKWPTCWRAGTRFSITRSPPTAITGIPSVFRHYNVVFFPLYALLMRWGGAALGGHPLLAGLIVSLAAFSGALVLLYRLALLELGEDYAWRVVLLISTFPYALYFSAVYTESLFLLLSVGAFYAMRRGRLGWVAVCGFAAGLTRPNGFWLALPLGLPRDVAARMRSAERDARARRGRSRPLALLAAVRAGGRRRDVSRATCSWRFGDPMAWVHGQAAWGVPMLLRAGAPDPGKLPGEAADQTDRSDRVDRQHRRVRRGGVRDPSDLETARPRLRRLDRRQHLPAGRRAPVHVARPVHLGAVPVLLLAGDPHSARARCAASPASFAAVSGGARDLVLSVASGGLREFRAQTAEFELSFEFAETRGARWRWRRARAAPGCARRRAASPAARLSSTDP